MHAEGREPRALYEYWAPTNQPLGQGGDMHFAFSFAAQAAEVEVNTLTGEVRVLRVIAANDVGRAINPLGLQGSGRRRRDDGSGQRPDRSNSSSKMAWCSPITWRATVCHRLRLTPEITSIVVEHPVAAGPYGAKGVGEIVSIPTTPAITNAIYNAVGVRIDRTPVDQAEIVRSIAHGRI